MTGRFITLEGGEGAGKTTQCARLVEALMTCHLPVVPTREPGGAPGAELLRGMLLAGGVDWAPQAETLLHFAARAEHVAKTIRPALEEGSWVVCDRFYDSTMAYQGYGQGADRRFISELIRLLGIKPDLTLVLDVPDPVAATRMRQRGGDADRYERLDAAFHARVREGFRQIAATEPDRCVVVDASGGIDAVHAAIMEAVDRLL
ncbi:dTMP kinase [Rhodopila globiformis]|uniref:Thymidylate kinase n=1 Tax=Rhodopila globiformis TaxID=1071 RepID=A0A2S6NIL4_RHOGL|nr:dTMP kinase [Rhodopila globiformis]PPQ34473.1 dTMP kinase [Rhodopila globiformis]